MTGNAQNCATLLSALFVLQVASTAQAESPDIQNTAGLFTAYQRNGPAVQQAELYWKSKLKWRVSDNIGFVISSRARLDPTDRLEPGRPLQNERAPANRRLLIGDSAEIELREAFVTLNIFDTDLTLGKQQIVWGQADGLKVLDVVNPQSFRAFILEEFDESRTPLWSAKIEKRIGPIDLQFVWSPDRTYHEIPSPDAAFGFTSLRFLPPVRPTERLVAISPLQRPTRLARDADFGGKASVFWRGWDLSAYYFRHYNDRPIYRLEEDGDGLVAAPFYDRQSTYGVSFARPVGDFVMRGEFSFVQDAAINASATHPLGDRIVDTDNFSYVIAADWRGLENTLVSVQFFQDRILSDRIEFLRPRTDNFLTFYARHTAFQDRVILDVRYLTNFNDNDGLVCPRIRIDISDNLRTSLGADIFHGDAQGVFGQFEKRSRAYLRIERNF